MAGAEASSPHRVHQPVGDDVANLAPDGSGLRVAQICHFGYRMQVLGHQRRLGALPEFVEGAALDVFETQPLPARHPLLTLDNVLLTPHIAGLTAQSMARMSQGTAEEVLRLLAGDRPVNLVNPEVWERRRR